MMGWVSLSLAALILVGCSAAAPSGDPLAGGAAKRGAYPNIQIREADGSSRVYWDDQLLVELKQNRFMRFRATPADENWVGSEKAPADLGWTYRDEGTKGMVVLSTARQNEPEKGRFVLKVSGKKPQFESRIDIELIGTWMPQAGKFTYSLWTRFQCPLESWYENTKFSQRGLPAGGKSELWTEVLDYCIEGISIPERLMSPNRAKRSDPPMYEWFVKSQDGKTWQKWPKVHIPYPVRPGSYITIRDLAHPSGLGGYYGFLDKARGGWMTRIEKTSSPVIFELCWARFDVHTLLQGAIPPRGSVQDLSLEFQLAFEPVDAVKGREIVAAAQELPWRDAPEYKLPLFSWDNRFDKLLTDLPGEETSNHMLWWPSSYDCNRDDSTGFDDKFSLTIRRKDASARPTAWTTLSWGFPFSEHRKNGRRFRLSAMVKTADCTGSVRIGQYSSVANVGDIYFGGGKSHRKDGTPITDGLVWEYSSPLSGTTDWTPLSLEFTVTRFSSILLLEQTGTGQCWFDNVKIEDLGPVPPEKKE